MIVACVGNAFRRDDGVGLRVASLLRGRLPEGVELAETEAEPTRLLDLLEGADAAVLVDAASSGAAPGTLHRVDVASEPLPHGLFRGSTHHFSLADTIELARRLGRLPGHAVVYAVEGAEFGAGEGLTPAVEAGASAAAEAVLEEVSRCTSAA